MLSARTRRAVEFVALALLWGASFPAIRYCLRAFDPFFLAATRFDLVGVVVLAYAVARGDRWRPTKADLPGVLAVGLLLIGAHNGLLYLGQDRVTSGVAAVVISTVPVLSTGFARALLPSDRLSPTGMAGVLVGLAGVVVIADPRGAALASSSTVGVALVFAAAVVFALGSVLTRRLRTDLPVASMQGWAMLAGGVCLHALSLAAGEPQGGALSPMQLASFAFLVLGAGAAGYLLYFSLLDRVGPVEINLVGYAEPVVAAVLGWALLAEALSEGTAVGFVLVFAGFLLVKRAAVRDAVTRWRAG